MLSVIIPAYNEEQNIPEVVGEVTRVLSQSAIEYEVVLVDDGSTDGTFAAIEHEASRDERVRGKKLSRNFGKEAAILAGLDTVRGACCAVLDADLQHPPAILPDMYKLWQAGAKIVHGVKADRGREKILYKVSAGVFYRMISRFTEIDFRRASDYKLLDRAIIDVIVALPEKKRFFRGLTAYYGFSQAEVTFSVAARKAGKTTWSPLKLFSYAMDNISSFTAVPLQFMTFLGALMLLLFAVLGIQTLYNYGAGRAVEGFTTVILLLLFTGSVLSIGLGVIGHYIAKIYEEVKARPPYIVEKTTGRPESNERI